MEYKEGAEYIEPVSNKDGSKSLVGGYWSSESSDRNLLRGLLARCLLKRAGEVDMGTSKWVSTGEVAMGTSKWASV